MKIDPGKRKKIFVLLSRVPWPLEKGDKLRAFYQLRELSVNNDIILCALSDNSIHKEAYQNLKPFVKELYLLPLNKWGIISRLAINIFKPLPFQVAYFFHKKTNSLIYGLIEKHKPDHIYCQLIRTARYIEDLKIDKTIDYQDVFSKGLERRIKFSPWYYKPLLKIEYSRVLKYEARVFDKFDKKTIISCFDREAIKHPLKEEIKVIPNGVDTEYFKPFEVKKQYDLIFSGNMGYPPNINAAEYLVRKIMPEVWKQKPDVSVVIAGANPSPSVKALAGKRVKVTGWVDDMRDYYSSSRIFIAPMQIGTGLQNKILEAMAMKLPCITSPLANKALNASNGKEILLGNNPEEFSKQILSLLNNTELLNSLSVNGYDFIQHNFNWQSVCRELEDLILQK